jgi:hypothetical protein
MTGVLYNYGNSIKSPGGAVNAPGLALRRYPEMRNDSSIPKLCPRCKRNVKLPKAAYCSTCNKAFHEESKARNSGLPCVRCGDNPREYGSYCRSCNCENARTTWAKPESNERYKQQTREWKQAHPERVSELNKQSKERIRAEVFAMLGDKCAKCGFNDHRALQIDHIHGAEAHERFTSQRAGSGLRSAILRGDRDIREFQLLCANCNWIKRFEDDEHNPTTKAKRKALRNDTH